MAFPRLLDLPVWGILLAQSHQEPQGFPVDRKSFLAVVLPGILPVSSERCITPRSRSSIGYWFAIQPVGREVSWSQHEIWSWVGPFGAFLMKRSLSFGLAGILCFALSASAADKPTPAMKRILDKAILAVKKNREEFAKANEGPLQEARKDLQDLAKKLVGDGKADDAAVVLKQVGTLEADVLGKTNASEPKTKAALKTPSLEDRLQGEWAKANNPHSFKIQGHTLLEFSENAPLQAHAKGKLEFPQGKEHAVVKLDNGFSFLLFSAGQNVMAMDVFDPQGKLTDNGVVLYKRGFQP